MSQQSNANPAFVHPYGIDNKVDIADPKPKSKAEAEDEDEDLSLEEALSSL